MLHRIAAHLAEVSIADGHAVTASFGVAVFGGAVQDEETLLRSADAAMYAAKRAGKDVHLAAVASRAAVHPNWSSRIRRGAHTELLGHPRSRHHIMPTPHLQQLSRLRGFLEVTRLVRSENELDDLLAAIARAISSSLGFATVAVHLYRPAWDDFAVTTVHGCAEVRERLMGDARERAVWEPLLQERFLHDGAYLIPHGEIDWEAYAPGSYVPKGDPGDEPESWHPEDALFVPLRHSDGHLIGILSVDEPASGLRPTCEELEILVAMADHAAIAVQSAQEAAAAARHRAALEQLLAVSSRLTETFSIDAILQSVCDAIRTALEFENVCVDLPDPETGAFRSRAASGLGDDRRRGCHGDGARRARAAAAARVRDRGLPSDRVRRGDAARRRRA